MQKQPKLDALTGLRYFAAATVIGAHVAHNIDAPWIYLFRDLSWIGMPLFFTLSGFLMCYNYFDDLNSGRPLAACWRFYTARFARIYPAYLLVLLMSFSYMGNFFHDVKNFPDDTARTLRYAGTLTQSWVHKPVFLADAHPRTITTGYLAICWSVSTEMFFYATFPLTIPLLRRLTSHRKIIAAIGGIWLAYLAWDLHVLRALLHGVPLDDFSFERWITYLSPYGRIGEFWIGCLVGRLVLLYKDAPITKVECLVASAAGWTCLVALFALVALRRESDLLKVAMMNVGIAPLCGLLIYLLARYPSSLQALFARRPLVLLGEASYCMFLLHPLVQSFFLQRTAGEAELKRGYILFYNHTMMFLTMHFLALGVYQFFETPVRMRLRRWLNPQETQRAALPVLPEPILPDERPLRRAA
jgi:peptidoglycan/LPS O-acetylase OafA/YrhL